MPCHIYQIEIIWTFYISKKLSRLNNTPVKLSFSVFCVWRFIHKRSFDKTSIYNMVILSRRHCDDIVVVIYDNFISFELSVNAYFMHIVLIPSKSLEYQNLAILYILNWRLNTFSTVYSSICHLVIIIYQLHMHSA